VFEKAWGQEIADLHEHVVLADIFSGHAYDLGGFAFPERRDILRGNTSRLARRADDDSTPFEGSAPITYTILQPCGCQ
jgi:hypothetical protein